MEYKREPTEKEKKLINLLIKRSTISYNRNWNKPLLVSPMNDGNMGSLFLYPKGYDFELRKFGWQISELEFKDIDGVNVVVSLNVDNEGELYELDIWKTDFNQLIEIPDNLFSE
ncbi:hypothetical protein [Dysgonomonas sp. BGC7]|uniref:DUF6984 family protein n=1 Tax=Dysgonomonas sp. BGC7 TaxID=1658008 RepID=UPI000680CB99|nr:hypothetical protein [Dysgonomonas sp. BGC7]MBD8388715.1 hypothetical protein [Dysgonomonas sp. BGC7]